MSGDPMLCAACGLEDDGHRHLLIATGEWFAQVGDTVKLYKRPSGGRAVDTVALRGRLVGDVMLARAHKAHVG